MRQVCTDSSFVCLLAGGTCPLASFSPPTSTDLTPFLLLCSFIDELHASVSHAFDETNSFGVTLLVPSLFCGLLHDVFQRVSAYPIPIEICYGMLSHAFDETNSFGVTLFGVFTVLWASTRRFSACECSPIPIEICYGMLSDMKDTKTLSLCLFVCI